MNDLPDVPTAAEIAAAIDVLKSALLRPVEPVEVRPPFYTVVQLEEMGIGSKSAVYKLMADGELTYSQTPGGRVVRAEDLDAYLRSVRSA